MVISRWRRSTVLCKFGRQLDNSYTSEQFRRCWHSTGWSAAFDANRPDANVAAERKADRAVARDARQRVERDRLRALRVRIDTLTPREFDVLRRVVEGRLNKQIAAALDINERTVKLHRTAITTKLKMRSVAELTKFVQAARLFDERVADLP
jgi:DNA-binding CsgD family transcriptional regulator